MSPILLVKIEKNNGIFRKEKPNPEVKKRTGHHKTIFNVNYLSLSYIGKEYNSKRDQSASIVINAFINSLRELLEIKQTTIGISSIHFG
jgi:hypothetical protein